MFSSCEVVNLTIIIKAGYIITILNLFFIFFKHILSTSLNSIMSPIMFDPLFSFVIIPSEASTDSPIDDLQELDITVWRGVEG